MDTTNEEKKITIKDLKEHLSTFSDDCELYFEGLEFYRVKKRGDNLVQIEFNEKVHRDKNDNVVIESPK